jgi:predicted Zn-dependent protease
MQTLHGMTRLLCTGCALLLALGACATNPATGKKQLSLVSKDQEVQLGQQGAEQVRQSIGLYPDPKAQAYVEAVGKRLVARAERPELPWSFQVVDDPTVNAFALPGGPIFITRGILAHMNSEAELAGVMGHEIAHITARHSVQQLSKAQLATLGLGIGSILSPEVAQLGQVAAAGLQLLFLKYGRDAERESDTLGFGYMLEAGYDPREMADMFQTLDRVGDAAGGGGLPEWLATHPNPENRFEAVQQRVAGLKRDLSGLEVDRESHLAILEGMVFGEDPRQGYFKGSTFLHPQLKMQLQFPQGWKTANTPQAVMGVSPQQDAMVGLSGAGNVSPEQALEKFFSQQGIQAGQGGRVAGGVARYFQAQTEQGVIAGLVSFVSFGGATWQLLGYTSAQGLPTYDPLFQQFMASLAPVSDPQVLNVQPARLALVKVDQPMTLQQFNERYPSSVPLEKVALINALKPGDSIPAGTTLKRVVGGTPGLTQEPAR